jgi:hypothetical protein
VQQVPAKTQRVADVFFIVQVAGRAGVGVAIGMVRVHPVDQAGVDDLNAAVVVVDLLRPTLCAIVFQQRPGIQAA